MQIDHQIAPRLLVGKTALVTGAGQGNGRALARGMASAGAQVLVTDRDGSAAEATAEMIQLAGGDARAFELDVTDAPACEALAGQWQDHGGTLDILVNNAGILVRTDSDDPRALAIFRQVIDVNLHGALNVTLAFLPALKASRGCIIHMASITAFAGQPASLGYAPSKGAIRLLTQSQAIEFARHGIRVNALAPGVIETPMTRSTREDPAKLAAFMSRTPMSRVGQPEELIGPAVFLASPMASYVTGVTLAVDGGFLAG